MNQYISYAFVSMLFGGLTSAFVKVGLKNISGDTAFIVRAFLICGLSCIYALGWGFHKELKNIEPVDFFYLTLSAGTTFGATLFLYKAIKVSDQIMIVTLIEKSSVIVTLIISVLIFKEHEQLNLRSGIGIAFILAGFFALFGKQ